MAGTLRIRRRASTGAAGAPATLAAAEIAYNEKDDILYYGKGDAAGMATSIIPIAGPGFTGFSCTLSDTPPTGKNPGDFWYEMDSGLLFIFVDDGTSRQWVVASPTTSTGPQGAPGNVGAVGPQGPPGGCTISDTPPSTPNVGDMWFESDAGIMWVWVVDANSSQWVQYSGGGVSQITDSPVDGVTYGRKNAVWSAAVAKSGDTMTGSLRINKSLDSTIYFGAGDNWLYWDETSAFVFNKSVIPAVTGTLNLGSATGRWGTVYTSDLSLSNGIGDWTIVEGEDDLFLYNNKRGKTYKFALMEVDPSMVPLKKA